MLCVAIRDGLAVDVAVDVTVGVAIRMAVGLGGRGRHIFLLTIILTLILILGSVIPKLVLADEAPGNASDAEQPEKVEGLEGGEQSGGDDLAQAALVLLRLPVQLKGTDSLELGQQRPDDLEVEVVAEVDPSHHEDAKVRAHQGGVDVVERLGSGQEEVADVVGDIDGQTDVSEVEAVAEADESQSDNVVTNKLLEILARLLHTQDEDNGLLSPVGRLKEVVELDRSQMGLVGEPLVHAAGVEVPHGSMAHDPEAKRTQDTKVDGRVHLLHEAGLLATAEIIPASERREELLHNELAGERQDNGIEGDKSDIPATLSILSRFVGVVLRQLVREEDEVVDRVGLGRVDGVSGEEAQGENSREDESVLDHGLASSSKETASTSALGESLVARLKLHVSIPRCLRQGQFQGSPGRSCQRHRDWHDSRPMPGHPCRRGSRPRGHCSCAASARR